MPKANTRQKISLDKAKKRRITFARDSHRYQRKARSQRLSSDPRPTLPPLLPLRQARPATLAPESSPGAGANLAPALSLRCTQSGAESVAACISASQPKAGGDCAPCGFRAQGSRAARDRILPLAHPLGAQPRQKRPRRLPVVNQPLPWLRVWLSLLLRALYPRIYGTRTRRV